MTFAFLSRLANRLSDIKYLPPFDRPDPAREPGSVTILLYHRVALRGEVDFLDRYGTPPISPEQLRRELTFFRSQGYCFVDPRDFVHPEFRAQANRRSVMITFDDGLADTYRLALPIVEEFGARALVFQISGIVGESRPVWEHELYWHHFHACSDSDRDDQAVFEVRERYSPVEIDVHLRGLRQRLRSDRQYSLDAAFRALYPVSGDLISARARGHLIGSHGHHHFKRANISRAEFESELALSQRALSRLLQEEVRTFSYPFNSFCSGDHAIAREQYSHVFSVDDGSGGGQVDRTVFPRLNWTGPHRNFLRERRWLQSGRI